MHRAEDNRNEILQVENVKEGLGTGSRVILKIDFQKSKLDDVV
jgi:hypothetical protein